MREVTLRRVMIGLAVLGIGVAGYLTEAHYSGGTTICPLHGGCETVQHSIYSKLAGIPVALIGLIGYVVILCSLLVPQNETTRLTTAVLSLGGFAFSAYLTFRELFSIHAICPWCVSSAVIMTVLACLAVWRFLRGAPPEVAQPSLAGPAADSPQPEPSRDGQALPAGAEPDGALAPEGRPLTIN
jgi:uncharacterized membrane protein